MGLISVAEEMYEEIIKMVHQEDLTESLNDIKTRAVYNLSLIYKGSGINTGAVIQEGA